MLVRAIFVHVQATFLLVLLFGLLDVVMMLNSLARCGVLLTGGGFHLLACRRVSP